METKMMNNEYRFDHAAQTITLTKKFNKAAGTLGSREYRILKQLRADYPDYTIELKEIAKKEGKKSYAKLTYDAMRKHICLLEGEASANLRNLNACIEAYKGSGCYPKIKKWFLDNYPDYAEANATMDKCPTP